MLHKFVAQQGRDVEVARNLLQAGDVQGALDLLHGLSGVASLLQARALADLAVAGEEALRAGQLEAMPGLFDALAQAMQTLRGAVQRVSG